jgi:hypothetical protein
MDSKNQFKRGSSALPDEGHQARGLRILSRMIARHFVKQNSISENKAPNAGDSAVLNDDESIPGTRRSEPA